ncbi:MAG: hypothetical protein COS39_08265 [Hydrogenophilales bacterium CG03_land_8_20_14_0_80_62_28]|nr:MAG: hypothetical protein AUJ86_10400 [Hydrogenophilaceae bacterium CG1_02_62_390]PIV22260.1 MAG: hypothetical protein COS39_08265 [Hydrogenophilales bacterium CG03_land_8_20_14_0_80_62_28]PIW39741.1 MAG: hypothetical protein COW23_00520 [Hydrogenophilales bacterium CG15_BIG_FIL_POST_REV_8_21_14_020_62_31]PIW72070.1 MAG: hypothetical protein COW07_05150 [Hydrogenophilales bacterium CG12_big_fil_rev_8_21_14_0_65_61_21]PIX01663.1 MAG: hypothetical protein COZ79_05820 [Hydrogenophilales bacteri
MRPDNHYVTALILFGLTELVLAVWSMSGDWAGRGGLRTVLIAALILGPILALVIVYLLRASRRRRDRLERSEQRADLALECARMAYWDVDIATGKGAVNARWHELLGTVPEQVGDRIHNTWVAMLHPDDRQRVLEVGRRYKQGEIAGYEVEYRSITGQGETRWFASKGMMVGHGTERSPQRMVGVFQDITERKQVEVDLRHAKDEAETANRVKSELLANVSGHIRAPMNGILELTRTLLNSPLGSLQHTQIGILKESSESLLEIIDDLLDFAKIEAGSLSLAPKPTAVREIVRLTLQPLYPLTQAKRLQLSAVIDDDVPDQVVCDPLRLRQILANLLSNAIKYTDAGRIEIGVTRQAETDSHLRLEFSVQDTGIGIPAKTQSSIFELFKQTDDASVRYHDGSGLGLTIAAHLVGLMGGRIELASSPGQGSRFSFVLDLEKVVSRDAAATSKYALQS